MNVNGNFICIIVEFLYKLLIMLGEVMSKKKTNSKQTKNKKQVKKQVNNKVSLKSEKDLIVKKEEPKKSFMPYYLIIAGIALLVFCFIYGFRVLNPTCTDWIFASEGDIMQHYVGWESFRAGDWTFPIGLTNATSYPTNISVIYTDSIPIVALFFKLISFILPKTFQFLGLYGLLCFILQGILSAQIVKKFTDSKLNIIVVSMLFTIIPSMIFRMFYHTALASQWLILLSLETIFLYNDFKDGKKIYYMWALIAFLVATIHIYYLLMCGIILVGFILLDILNTKKLKKSVILLGIYILVALVSIWIFGGFVNLGENDSYGFGLFSYNLNGLVNSQGWSVFVEELPMIPEQYEGFSYLGLGVIILILIAIVLVVMWILEDKEVLKRYKNLIISLAFISIISIFVALSPKAYIGEYLLYELELPSFITDLWGVFRSTGRFVWPVIHILTLLSVIVVLKRLNWKYSLLVLSACTFVQIIDMGEVLLGIHEFYIQEYAISDEANIYENEYLKKVASNDDIKLLVMVSDNFYDSDKFLYSDWALQNGLKTNTLHFARTSFDEMIEKNTVKLLKKKDETKAFVFTTEEECTSYQLKCYELPFDYYLGYVNELS